jgi:hypothetical protein
MGFGGKGNSWLRPKIAIRSLSNSVFSPLNLPSLKIKKIGCETVKTDLTNLFSNICAEINPKKCRKNGANIGFLAVFRGYFSSRRW